MASETSSTQVLVLEAVKVLHTVDKTLISILTQMRNLANGLPEYETFISMPGIGKILAPRIIAEIRDVRRLHFRCVKVTFI